MLKIALGEALNFFFQTGASRCHRRILYPGECKLLNVYAPDIIVSVPSVGILSTLVIIQAHLDANVLNASLTISYFFD